MKLSSTRPAFENPPAGFNSVKTKLTAKMDQLGRTDFIRNAQLSNPTLIKIRAGAFPWLEKGRGGVSVRQLVAWARTLTRLATLLDEDPATVIRATGLDRAAAQLNANPELDDAIQRESKNLRDRGMRVVSVEPRELDIIRRMRADGKVRYAILDQQPFSVRLFGGDESFFSELAKRLVGTINPDWEPRYWDAPSGGLPNQIGPLVEGLAKDEPEHDFGVGLFETVYRRLEGLDFLPIPGWRISLGAFWVGKTVGENKPPTWDQIASPSGRNRYRAVVIHQEAGYLYLKGHCRYESTSLEEVAGDADFDAIAKRIANVARHEKRDVIFVADEETCYHVKQALAKRDLDSESVPVESASFPTYPLSIVFKFGDSQWKALLKAAIDDELFGNALGETASMYAGVMAHGALQFELDPKRPQSTWRPCWFELGNPRRTAEFWVTVYDKLFKHLAGEVASTPAYRERFPSNKEIHRLACQALPEELRIQPKLSQPPVSGFYMRTPIHQHVASSIQTFQKSRNRSMPGNLLLADREDQQEQKS